MFSEVLKTLRSKKGLTQTQLAKEIGVSTGNIGDWEIGRSKPGYTALAALARFFEVSSDYLLGLSPENTVLLEDPPRARLEIYCDGEPLSESEADLVAMYRLLPEDHREEAFDIIYRKYTRLVAGDEKESIYSTYSDTNKQQKSVPTSGGEAKSGTA